ncbi:hypothetical protein J2751_002927 [Halorubrum alkaliphilum]|uniref:Uncharacterized protein n=1 Tax=Halorubrum alkaliphilum TaxID=261290 RepID=A0A8T4GKI3_9EURY|nr:hypothetical protein [Halorubrum alkaliphilum]
MVTGDAVGEVGVRVSDDDDRTVISEGSIAA